MPLSSSVRRHYSYLRSSAMPITHSGSCMRGRVKFNVTGPLNPPDACHCVQCRKQSGHYFASTNVLRSSLTVSGQDNITWHHSSEKVRRGFCSTCGSNLFWDPPARDWISIGMGAFDSPTDTELEIHVFVAEKGDYYQITDGLPQNAQ
nr:putative integron gene cassette protein [uncultured bacterium]